MTTARASISEAVSALGAGRMVLVHADGDDEGDVVVAARFVTPEQVNFMATHARGIISVALTGAAIDRLGLPAMTARNPSPRDRAFTVSVEAAHGISTGISAADRAMTIRVVADPCSTAGDLVRPGHVFPLRARSGGVVRHPGRVEAAVELARLAGVEPAGALCQVMRDDGTMARLADLLALGDRHGLPLISIADLVEHCRHLQTRAYRLGELQLPTAHGTFRALRYRNADGDGDAIGVAVLKGRPEGRIGVAVGVHHADGPSNALRSLESADRLFRALRSIATEEAGVLVVLEQGRGAHEATASILQDLRLVRPRRLGHDRLAWGDVHAGDPAGLLARRA